MSESSADEEEIRSAKRSKMDKVVEISGTDERRPTRGSSRVAAVAAKKLLSQVAKNRSETPTTPPSRRPRGRPRKGTTAAATPKNSVKKPPGSRARKKRRREIDEGSSDDSDVEEFVFPTQSDLEGEEDQLDFNLYESDVDLDAEPEDFGDTISIQSGSKASRFCPWIDQEETLAPLHLPLSSEDLLIPLRLIPAVLEIYEVLRRFGRTMRLSPFRIEDFCAGLMAVEFSPLIMEIHLALLKSLMREDELNGTTLSRLEEKSFSYAATHLPLDLVTWPALLKSYLESHPKFDSLAKEICAHPLFPQVSTEEKVCQSLACMVQLSTENAHNWSLGDRAEIFGQPVRCHRTFRQSGSAESRRTPK